jgi:hypothetical protein
MAQREPIGNCFHRGSAMREQQGRPEAERHRRRQWHDRRC